MALFNWSHKPWGGAEIGDTRRIIKFIWLPTLLGGEWRWIGWEVVIQEHAQWETVSPSFPFPVAARGWRDVAWAPETGKGRSL